MYEQLASTIRTRLDSLTDQYERRLREFEDYARMPVQARMEAARSMLGLAAAWLESGDDSGIGQFLQAKAAERAAQGFEVDALHRSLIVLEEILLPLVADVETARFVWRALARARSFLSQWMVDSARES